MDGQIDGWTDGWMDQWIDGWVDGGLCQCSSLKITFKKLCTEHLAAIAVGRGGNPRPTPQLSFLNYCIIYHLTEGHQSTKRQHDGAVRVDFPSKIIIVIRG